MLITKGRQGQAVPMRVQEVKDKTFVVDFNSIIRWLGKP